MADASLLLKRQLLFTLLALLGLVLVATLLILNTRGQLKLLINEFDLVVSHVKSLATRDVPPKITVCNFEETEKIQDTILGVRYELDSLAKEQVRNERLQAQADMAYQVLHDIRSPLAALSIVANAPGESSSSIRPIIKSAANRICEIVDELKKKNVTPNFKEKVVLYEEVMAIVSEKRARYQSKPDLKIVTEAVNGLGQSAKILAEGSALRRVLSNLIDNSVDALPNGGTVTLKVYSNSKQATVEISDDGIGIPTEKLPTLGQKGNTFAKENGSGLGLYYSFEKIREWGGSIKVDSVVGRGTRFTFAFDNPLI